MRSFLVIMLPRQLPSFRCVERRYCGEEAACCVQLLDSHFLISPLQLWPNVLEPRGSNGSFWRMASQWAGFKKWLQGFISRNQALPNISLASNSSCLVLLCLRVVSASFMESCPTHPPALLRNDIRILEDAAFGAVFVTTNPCAFSSSFLTKYSHRN